MKNDPRDGPGYPVRPQAPLRPLVTAEEAYPALERAVAEARQSIWLAYRVFEPWTVLVSEGGRHIAGDWIGLLRQKLAEGVQVRLMLSDFDALGGTSLHERSWRCLYALSPLWEHGDFAALPLLHMARAGLLWRLAFWGPAVIRRRHMARDLNRLAADERRRRLICMPALWPGFRLDRDGKVAVRPQGPPVLHPATYHQKFAVIDAQYALIGGLDLNQRRFDDLRHMRPTDQTWADAAVGVEGPLATDLARHFAECWAHEAGQQIERVEGLRRHAPDGLAMPPMPEPHQAPRLPARHEAESRGEEARSRAAAAASPAAASGTGAQPAREGPPGPRVARQTEGLEGERLSADNPLTGATCEPAPAAPAPAGGTMQLVRTVSSAADGLGLMRLEPRTVCREIESAHVEQIGAAQKLIYIETQFLRSRRIVEALRQAARRNAGLGLIVVLPLAPMEIAYEDKRRFVERLGERLQARAVRRLRKAFGARAVILSPLRPSPATRNLTQAGTRAVAHDAEMIFVHTKAMTVDDQAAIIGSANLNGRSLSWDVEVSVRIDGGAGPAALRRRLFEHWLPDDAPEAAFALDTAPAEWRRIAFEQIARPPASRDALIAPYPASRAWRFGRAVPGVPEDAL